MRNRYAIARQIEALDPKRDHQQIIYLLGAYGDPWLIRKSLEFALFRTYTVPRMTRILQSTGQFERHGQKRYDDTTLLLTTIAEQGYDSEFGRRAIEKMNYLHGHFNIPNEDFLYVLSVFIYEPLRWSERFGYRRSTDTEKLAGYYFWCEVGKRMGIQEIPTTFAAFQAWSEEYEQRHFTYAESNRAIGDATMQVILAWYPPIVRPFVRQGIYALMQEHMRTAFDYPQANILFRWATPALLRLRGYLLRIVPPRRTPYHHTEQCHRSYPRGYSLETLGPS